MSEERRKILEMLSDQKINTEEAERLLNALGDSGGETLDGGTAGQTPKKNPR